MLTTISFPQREVLPHTPSPEKAVFNHQLTIDSANKVLVTVLDIVHPDFKSWHFAQLYRLGASKYLVLADQARKGSQPARLFSSLLKGTA